MLKSKWKNKFFRFYLLLPIRTKKNRNQLINYEIHNNLLVFTKIVSGVRKLVAEVDSASPCVIIKDTKILTWLLSLGKMFDPHLAREVWCTVFGDTLKFAGVFDQFLNAGVIRKVGIETGYEEWKKYNWSEASVYRASASKFS